MGIINGSSVFCWRTAEENKQQQLARRLCACPQQNFFGSEFSSHTNSVIGFIFGLVLF